MRLTCAITLFIFTQILAIPCNNKKPSLKLVCYYSEVSEIDICKCTHIILPSNTNISTIENVKEKFREGKTLITVNEFNQNLIDILNKKAIDGVDINLKKLSDKSDVGDFISTVKSKLNSDLLIAVSLPSKPEVLAKFYNLKDLSKHAEFFILQTAFLASSHNVTFHPSRLSGVWDTHNTDSVVDLVHGLGAPLSKIVISAPVQAFQFTLQNASHNIAGGPALDVKSITRNQLCKTVYSGKNWTLERDQDQAGPYVFLKNEWIAFEDAISIDIKAKYARVRGLAGLALKDLSQDDNKNCKFSLLETAYNGLTKQARAPRSAVLQSLQNEILQSSSRPVDAIQISPYRISRIIDVEGKIHSVRKDTRTEFECSRQGYFMHPLSCGRFYRCVKFDQLSDDFNVFEFDCPDGLMFDSKTEVCVWPGSLPYTTPCSGSSEIAPVPKSRFICPSEEGYYADPENCRWFFACLDHGKSPLAAYEFRCPFGLMFDQNRLVCEWAWLVPICANEEAIKYTANTHRSLLNSYDGLGHLNVVKLAGLNGAANTHHLITAKHEDSSKNLYSNYNRNQFGQIVQPALFGNNYEALSTNLNTGRNTYFNKQNSLSNSFNYQNRGPFFKTLAISNEQAKVVGGISAVRYNSNNPQNVIHSDSVSILNPSPVAAVAAAPVPFIGTNQNTNKFEVVANVPELQYKVIANQGSGYNVNNLGYSKGFSSSGSFSQNYNSNPLSRNPIYVTNQGIPQPDVFSSKLNSYSVQHPVNYSLKNVGHSSQFGNIENSGLFKKTITFDPVVAVPNVLEKNGQVISQSGPLLQSYTNDQTASNGVQFIKSTLRQQSPVITSYNYDSRLNKPLTQNNQKIKQQVLEADQKVVNLGVAGNVREKSRLEYSSVEAAKPAIGTAYFYQNVKPQVPQNVNYPLNDNGAEQREHRRIQSFQSQQLSNIALNQQPVVVSTYNTHLTEAKTQQNLRENIEFEYAKQNSQQQNYNSAGYTSVEVKKPAIAASYIYHDVKPQVPQNYDYSLGNSRAELNAGQFEAQRIQSVQSSSSSNTVNIKGNTIEGYEYQKPAVVLQEPVIIANPAPINPIANRRKSKIVSSYSFQNLNDQNNQQKITSSPVVQATYSQNIGYSTAAFENSQNVEDGFTGYKYTTPNTNTQNLEISSSTPTPIVEQQKTSIASSYSNFGKEKQDNAQIVQTVHAFTPITTEIRKIQPIIYSAEKTEQNQNYNNGQAVQSFSNSFINPNRILDAEAISNTTPLSLVRESVTQKSSEVNLGQNNDVIINFGTQHQQSIAQSPVKQTYYQDYYDGLAEDEQIFSNIKNIDKTALEYEYTQPQVVFGEKESKPLVIERFATTAPKQLLNFNNEEENYKYNVQFSPQRIQTYAVPNINFQNDYIYGDYVEQKPRVGLSQNPFQLSSGGQKIVENYNIKNKDWVEKKQINQEFEETSLPIAKSTLNIIEDFIGRSEDNRQQPVIKETVQKSSFQGYDYPKSSIEFHEGAVEDCTNRQPVQEEPIVAKQAYLTYDRQNGASGQYTTAKSVYSPTIATIVANKPTGTFYYSDSRLQSTSNPLLQSVVISNTGNQLKTDDYLAVQKSSFQGYDYPKPSVEFQEDTVENYKNRQPVQEEPIVAKQAYLTYDKQNSASGQITTAKSVYSPTISTIVANNPTGTFYYSDSRSQSTSNPLLQSVVISNTDANQLKTDDYLTVQKSSFQGYDYPKPSVEFREDTVENYKNRQPVQEKPIVANQAYLAYDKQNGASEQVTTAKSVYSPTISTIAANKPTGTFYYSDSRSQSISNPLLQSVVISNTANQLKTDDYLTVQKSSFQGYDYPKPSIEFHEGTVEDYKNRQPVQEEPIVTKEAYLTYDRQNGALEQSTTAKSLYAPSIATIVDNKPTGTFYYSDSRSQSSSNQKTDDYLTEQVSAPKQTYLPTKTVQEFESELDSDITITTKPPTTKTYVRINDAHPLLPAKLKAQCTCTSNTVTLRRRLPTTTPSIPEEDLYPEEKKELVLNQRKTIVIENYSYRPTTVEAKFGPVESISSTSAPIVVIKKRVRPVTSTPERSSKIKSISFIEKPKIENLENSFKGYELVKNTERLPKSFECQRAGLFRHPEHCNKFYSCIWDCTKNKFKLHVFNCPVHLTFDFKLGACNWPSKGPACEGNTLLPNE